MWDLEGLAVEGFYLDDIPVEGNVVKSRVKYGGGVQHTVQLTKAFSFWYGKISREVGETVLVDHQCITRVKEVA